MPLVFREGPPVDPVQLGSLFVEAGFSRSQDPEYLTAMVEGSRWVVSAWEDGELIGFARAISDGVSNAYVSTVAVRTARRRQGIGRELMRRILADRVGVRFVLHTRPEAAGLYRSLGFVDADHMLVRPRG